MVFIINSTMMAPLKGPLAETPAYAEVGLRAGRQGVDN